MGKSILIVEDNVDMRSAISQFLISKGYEITNCETAEEAYDKLSENLDIGIILLDINLPGLSGFDLAKLLKNKYKEKTPPIIAMTARDSVGDKLKGFEIGFNDYIVKPFDLRELLARVEVHLKTRNDNHDVNEDLIKHGDYSIDRLKMEFLYQNKSIQLTNLEFRLMTILLENFGNVVSLDDIIEYVWGDDGGISNPPIRIHIGNLRKKINDDDFSKLKTLPSVGYKLVS